MLHGQVYTIIVTRESGNFGWIKEAVFERKDRGRHTSTILREIRRNSDGKEYYYYPSEAQAKSQKRKAKHGFKVDRIDGLKVYVIEKLKKYWSPIAIAGRWTLEHPANKITKEAIYAWIYGPEGKALGMPKLLPRAKPKRGLVRAKKSKNYIPDRVPLEARSDNANARSELGHLEGILTPINWTRVI